MRRENNLTTHVQRWTDVKKHAKGSGEAAKKTSGGRDAKAVGRLGVCSEWVGKLFKIMGVEGERGKSARSIPSGERRAPARRATKSNSNDELKPASTINAEIKNFNGTHWGSHRIAPQHFAAG